jgi:hypothetical protein
LWHLYLVKQKYIHIYIYKYFLFSKEISIHENNRIWSKNKIMLFYYHAKSVLVLLFAFASGTFSILLAMKTCFSSKHLSPTDITKGKFEYTCSVKPRRII